MEGGPPCRAVSHALWLWLCCVACVCWLKAWSFGLLNGPYTHHFDHAADVVAVEEDGRVRDTMNDDDDDGVRCYGGDGNGIKDEDEIALPMTSRATAVIDAARPHRGHELVWRRGSRGGAVRDQWCGRDHVSSEAAE